MVNLDELRKKYEQINNPGQGGNQDFLKKFFMMDDGTSYVRLLPPHEEDTNFYAETAIHRINDRNYHCPREKGEKCPLCDTYYGLWKRVNELGKDNPNSQIFIDTARQIKARKRFYMNVVDRRDDIVKILSVGQKLFSKILDAFFDEDYGDITDPAKGWDFKIIKEKIGGYPNYDKSAPRPKSTPAGSDAELAEWMDSLHDVHGLVKLPEYDDLKQLAMDIEGIVGTPERPAPSHSDSAPGDSDFLSHLKDVKVE
jgi:hypothetical protein